MTIVAGRYTSFPLDGRFLMRTTLSIDTSISSWLRGTASVLVLGLIVAGCGDRAGAQNDEEPAQPSQSAEMALPADQAGPDTTEAAVWTHLQEEAYRDNWALWPGTGELYSGTEPHGMLLTTYLNATAEEALAGGTDAGDLPFGSIVVKENYMPDSTYAAATVMYRVEGYNPDHDDWLFAKYNGPRGEVEAFGRAAGCQACHQEAQTGYIYTSVQP